jgi:hypothetical protein
VAYFKAYRESMARELWQHTFRSINCLLENSLNGTRNDSLAPLSLSAGAQISHQFLEIVDAKLRLLFKPPSLAQADT